LDFPGCIGVADGPFDEQDIALAGRIVARYGKGRGEEKVEIIMKKNDEVLRQFSAKPFAVDDAELQKMIVS